MKKLFFLLTLTLGGIACQSTDSSTFGVDPQQNRYLDEAPLTQKLYCNSPNCENPYAQEVYTYTPAGQLIRMDQFSRNAAAQLEKVSYTDYRYSPAGQLSGAVRYSKHGTIPGWVAYEESEYAYTNGVLVREQTYFNQHNPDQRVLTGSIDYRFSNGNRVEQTWYDAQQTLSRRVVNEYKNNTLIRQIWYGPKNDIMRRFEHQFTDNRRQISEYLPSSTELISQVEKTYDAQGRVSSEETKVINLLLCSMQAGVIRYVY